MTINAIAKPFQFCFLFVPPTNSYKIKFNYIFIKTKFYLKFNKNHLTTQNEQNPKEFDCSSSSSSSSCCGDCCCEENINCCFITGTINNKINQLYNYYS